MESSSEDIVHIVFKVVCQSNKKQYDTYNRQNVPVFQCVNALREYLLATFKDELSPTDDAYSFRLGYMGCKNRKFTIATSAHLAEAYSTAKDGWVTLWGDPHIKKAPKDSTSGSKLKFSEFMAFNAKSSEDTNPVADLESCVIRLRNKHGKDMPEFKLRVWAKMLVNGTHNSEDLPPQIPFFSGRKAGVARTATSGTASTSVSREPIVDQDKPQGVDAETKVRMRSAIIQQLKDFKNLEEIGVLTDQQFIEQKAKLLEELSSL